VDAESERIAVAVIRAWIEVGVEGALKVRVTTRGDLEGTTETIGVASSIDGACAIVRAWLEGFVADQPSRAEGQGRAS
jgi:hypothetical protein